jgi:hypothetical protein
MLAMVRPAAISARSANEQVATEALQAPRFHQLCQLGTAGTAAAVRTAEAEAAAPKFDTIPLRDPLS